MKKISTLLALVGVLVATLPINAKDIMPLVPDIYPQGIKDDLQMQLNGIIIKTSNLSGSNLDKAFKNYSEKVVPNLGKLYGDVILFGLGPIVKYDLPENSEQIRALGAIQTIINQTFNLYKALFNVGQIPVVEFKASQKYFTDFVKDIGDKTNDYVGAKSATVKDNLVAQFEKIPNLQITMMPALRSMPDKPLSAEQKKSVIAYAEILEKVLTTAKKWLKIS